MLAVFFIAILGIMPFFLSRLLLRRAMQQWEETLEQVQANHVFHLQVNTMTITPLEQCEREENVTILGNTRCRYNARSPYLRCAVNPTGSCQNCRDFSY